MCRNITELRGLEPAATDEEIEAAARQYVRKVSGVTRPTAANADAFEVAVAEVTATTLRLLSALPPRRQPPKTVPPLRRPEVRARIAEAVGYFVSENPITTTPRRAAAQGDDDVR